MLTEFLFIEQAWEPGFNPHSGHFNNIQWSMQRHDGPKDLLFPAISIIQHTPGSRTKVPKNL